MSIKYVLVKFIKKDGTLSDLSYAFKTDIETLNPGDTVACDTANGLSFAEVEDYTTEESEIKLATKWIIDTIDMSGFKKRKLLEELEEKTEEMNKNRISRIKKRKSYKILAAG